jgi:hypothetical protein
MFVSFGPYGLVSASRPHWVQSEGFSGSTTNIPDFLSKYDMVVGWAVRCEGRASCADLAPC